MIKFDYLLKNNEKVRMKRVIESLRHSGISNCIISKVLEFGFLEFGFFFWILKPPKILSSSGGMITKRINLF